MGAEHVERMPEIKGIQVAVPALVRIRVGEMAPAGTVGNAMFLAFTAFAPAGKGDAERSLVRWEESR